MRCTSSSDFDNEGICFVKVSDLDGSNVAWASVAWSSGFPSEEVPDGQARTFWIRLAPINDGRGVIAHHVEVVFPVRTQNDFAHTSGIATVGGDILAIHAAADIVFDTVDSPAYTRRMVVVGENDIVGHDLPTVPGAQYWPISQMRAAYTGGRVSCAAWTQRNMYAASNDLTAAAWQIIQMGDEGAKSTVKVFFCLGFIEYIDHLCTAAQFGTYYGALLDLVHAARPTWAIDVGDIIQAFYDATTNGLGDNLQAFRTAITTMLATRPWATFRATRGPGSIELSQNTVLTAAGATTYVANMTTQGVLA
jgi:hypothetical protein